MSRRFTALAALSALASISFISNDADACGGCFIPPSESTVVTGHRMVMSVSKEQSVLWDQIRYSGDPAEFAWVLPIKEGAVVETASDAFFDVLEASTVANVIQPPEGCEPPPQPMCASADAALADSAGGEFGNDGVTVISQGTVGPYETVTLSATDPQALNNWLDDNGYSVPDEMQPVIDSYVAENFDFIALKLQPGQGVAAMTPVRVVTQGAGFSLPLRMVAAGAGAKVDLVLYVIGEGRYETANFDNVTVPPSLVTWNFNDDTSDYSELRSKALEANKGKTWLTSYAQPRAPLGFGPTDNRQLAIGQNFFGGGTIGSSYFLQGVENQEGGVSAEQLATCLSRLDALAQRDALIVENCDDMGVCAALEPGQVSADDLRCGELDDLAVALTGLHTTDVTLTRLEASLPRTALAEDLLLQAAADQDPIASQFTAGLKVNHCLDEFDEPRADGVVPFWKTIHDDKPLPPGSLMALALAGAGLFLLARRRQQLDRN